MPGGNALAITAKYPDPGAVKTRLARRLGFGLATAVYRAFLRDLDAKFSYAFSTVYWAYTPQGSPFPGFLGPGRNYLNQEGDDLGERMFELFRTLLFSKGHDKAVLIGSDLPHLSPGIVQEAFEKLEKHDLVLGPTTDGGYYLIGLRDVHDLFSYVSWSTPLVFSQTLIKAAALGLSVDFLPATFDVDEPEDLDKLLANLRDRGVRASMVHTDLVLTRLCRNGEALGQSKIGKYFKLTPEQVEREERECQTVVRLDDFAGKRVGIHMFLVAKVAGALAERLRDDVGIPLSDIAPVAARYHDACRCGDSSHRLRPYDREAKGVFFPHDGHEARLAFALRKTGAKTIARIIRQHCVLRIAYPEERTIDENILLLADAMVEAEQIVPVSVRRCGTIGRYASDDPDRRLAYDIAYDLVERTLETYFDAGLDKRRLYEDLGLSVSQS